MQDLQLELLGKQSPLHLQSSFYFAGGKSLNWMQKSGVQSKALFKSS
jgi:hypothetical protein